MLNQTRRVVDSLWVSYIHFLAKICFIIKWTQGFFLFSYDEVSSVLIIFKTSSSSFLNPFLTNVPILYPLERPENQRFSGVFRGYKIRTLTRNGLVIALSYVILKWRDDFCIYQFVSFIGSSGKFVSNLMLYFN